MRANITLSLSKENLTYLRSMKKKDSSFNISRYIDGLVSTKRGKKK
tara:strand:- start:1 stop:138 length:138 start_codon:yes stop_codon:yes gene_type:complete